MTPAADEREHFLPVRVADLTDLLCGGPEAFAPRPMADDDAERFRRFARAVSAHVHAVYRDHLRRLKDAYAPFDPDADPKPLTPLPPDEVTPASDRLFDTFTAVMERANYRRFARPELMEICRGASEWGVDMHICWEVFDRVEVFYRGKATGRRSRRPWWRFFRRQEVSVPVFRRVVVILKQKAHPLLGADADTRCVFLKLFKDIPRQDVEMLLPGTRMKMPLLERFKLGGSVTGSVGYVVWKLGTSLSLAKLGAAIIAGSFLTLYTPVALILGYGYKTYASFQVTRQTYTLQLTQSLYFQNLDSNAGVLHQAVNDAEEQETREVLLAYFYLWRHAGPAGWTADELAAAVERDLQARLTLPVDFEADDALRKLERAEIVTVAEGRYRAVGLDVALERLGHLWEKYARGEPVRPIPPIADLVATP